MDLMPHIKALLDDLINMTEHITVKRSDLARDEKETSLMLYDQYYKIMQGETSFEDFFVYPKYVLAQYTKWVETSKYESDFGSLVPLLGSNEIKKTINLDNTITFSKSKYQDGLDNIGAHGDIWVQYTGTDRCYKVTEHNGKSKEFSFKLYETDENGKIDLNKEINSFIMPGHDLRSFKSRNLYIYNKLTNTFIPVDISFQGEYVEYDENNFIEDTDYIIYKDNGDDIKNNLYVQNYRNNYEYISYIGDKDFENSSKYYYRYKIYLRYLDDKYYTNYTYHLVGEDIKSSESRIDDMEYYRNNDDLYLPIYEENAIGNYYKNNGKYELIFKQIENYKDYSIDSLYIYNEDTNNYEPAEELVDNVVYYIINEEITDDTVLYDKVIDTYDIYYFYYDREADKVENPQLDETDPTSYKFLIDDNNYIKIFYEYGDETPTLESKTCKFILYNNENIVTWNTIDKPDYNDQSTIITETITNYEKVYMHPTDIVSNRSYRPIYDSNGEIIYFEYDNKSGSYELSLTKIDDNDTEYAYDNTDYIVYRSNRILTSYQINRYNKNKNYIPEIYREDLAKLMVKYIINKYCPTKYNKDYIIPLYYGETNDYYRELNGLPPINKNVGTPKINRLTINPYYTGNNINCYVHELSDAEILIIKDNGKLDEIKTQYPNAKYLDYLGEDRIDVVEAREAAPYDILRIGDVDMTLTKTMFMDNYKIAKNYVLNRHYYPNMFGKHQYYHSYIGFVICVLTMILCMTKSGDILIQNKFMDAKTVDNIFRSFGFNGTFDSIPFIYKRNIARKIYSLIRNKGIDSIYENVIELFNIDADVYKYYFKKISNKNNDGSIMYTSEYIKLSSETDIKKAISSDNLFIKENDIYRKCTPDECKNYKDYIDNLYKEIRSYSSDITISQSSINSKNIIKDINNDSNDLNYDDITNNDIYWGVYQSKDSVKKEIENRKFNYMDSKYVTLNNRFSLTELNFNSAYLLNYLLEATKFNNNESISVSVENIEEPQLIQHLIITLFAIQAIKFGFDGNIPNDIISAASVFKFNLDSEVVSENGEIRKIIDYYLDYITQSSVHNIEDIETEINSIKELTNGSISSPIYNNKNDSTVTDIVKTYAKNTSIDNTLTVVDENSLYNKLIKLRENAKTISDFRCFNDLLTCISVCKETNKAYEFDNPVWEPMYEISYKRNKNSYVEDKQSEIIKYIDIRKSWDLLNETNKEIILSNLNDKKYYKLESYDNNLKSEYIDIEDYDPNKYNIIDDTIYYQPFIDLKDNYIISTSQPGLNQYNDKSIVICIYDLTRKELMSTPIKDLINKIDVYQKTDILERLNYEEYIKTLLQNDIYSTNIQKPIEYTSIEINNIAYIGNITLDAFIQTGYNLVGSPIYIECAKDTSKIEDFYKMTIYRKCNSALSYSMYLREKAPELYSYIQQISGEDDETYRERIDKFYSAIIATIEDNIESDKIKDNLNLSYVDFANVSKYIKLIINVFKSYTIDLASMDTIYSIDEKSFNRIKIIENYYTNEKYGIKSNIHVADDFSSKETYYNKDIMKIKDELYIEYYSRQFKDVDNDSVDDYYRINNELFDEDRDLKVSSYFYGQGLKQSFYVSNDIETLIGKKIE